MITPPPGKTTNERQVMHKGLNVAGESAAHWRVQWREEGKCPTTIAGLAPSSDS